MAGDVDEGIEMDLAKLKRIFRDACCNRVLFKNLSANDNSKNQIYLGGDFTAVNLIPLNNIQEKRANNISHTRRTDKEIFKADIDFAWIDNEGKEWQAPNVKMILYPQYPEVRMSGFLLGCKKAPSELLTVRQENRILFLGIRNNNTVLGYITGHDSSLAKEISEQKRYEEIGVFYELPLVAEEKSSKTILLEELGRIHKKGWITGKMLTARGDEISYNAPNAGGYTLEAELGIKPQGYAEPDFLGWEIKQHGVNSFERVCTGVITLMTPEPDGGFYYEEGVGAFLKKFGYKDLRGVDNRINFGGTHYVGRLNERTKLILEVDGYNLQSKKIDNASEGICLKNGEEIVAKWSYARIIAHWNRKHAQAAYVPSLNKKENGICTYLYGPVVRLGEETDILYLLNAMAEGMVFYDPGIKQEYVKGKVKIKRRSQFRIKSCHIPKLYRRFEERNVILPIDSGI